MTASIVVGVSYAIMWLIWSIQNWKRRPYAWKAGFCTVAMIAAASLEVGDFPPFWGIF